MFFLKYLQDGREHHFRGEAIDPISFAALRDCLRSGRRDEHQTVAHGYLCDASGASIGERSILRARIRFKETVPFYGLVRGGVIPPAYLRGTTLLLDRSVVATFKKAAGWRHPHAPGVKWNLDFLDSSSTTVNPMMGAFEGTTRRERFR